MKIFIYKNLELYSIFTATARNSSFDMITDNGYSQVRILKFNKYGFSNILYLPICTYE